MDSLQNKICIHAGTQGGSILGFHGSLNVMKNLYAYSPNLVSKSLAFNLSKFRALLNVLALMEDTLSQEDLMKSSDSTI